MDPIRNERHPDPISYSERGMKIPSMNNSDRQKKFKGGAKNVAAVAELVIVVVKVIVVAV